MDTLRGVCVPYRSGKAIAKATKSTYTLTTTDRGKTLKVRVSASAEGYGLTVKEYSVSVPLLEFATTPTPSVSGTARSG